MREKQSQFSRIDRTIVPPEVKSMYEISGHEEITGKVFDRYERSKRHDVVIEGMITEADLFLEKYHKAELQEKPHILWQGLESDDILVQRKAASCLIDLLENAQEHKKYVEKALTIPDRIVQTDAAIQILYFNPNEKYQCIQKIFSDPQCDPYICRVLGKDVIPTVTPAENKKILEKLAGNIVTKIFFDVVDSAKKESQDNQTECINTLQYIPFQAEHIPIIEIAIQKLPSPTALIALDIAEKNSEELPFYNLLLLAIDRSEEEIQNKAVEMNKNLQPIEKQLFLNKLADHLNPSLYYRVLLEEKNTTKEIIQKCFENPDTEIQCMAVNKIFSLNEQEQIECIEKAIHLSDRTVQERIGHVIVYLPNNEDKKRIINSILKTDNFVLQEMIINDIQHHPSYVQTRKELKEKMKGYENNGLDHRRFALYSKVLSPSDRIEMENMLVSVTKQLITSTNREEQESGIALIASLSQEKRLNYYLECLQIKDSAVIEKIIDKAFIFLTEQQKIVFFAEALRKNDFSLQRKMIKKMKGISFNETVKKGFFNQAKLFAPEALIASPLYDDIKKMKIDGLARENFKKTGSRTTLLLGDLQEKVIVRSAISAISFKAWKEIYEDFDSWKKAQFDYVPIEPILSYQPNSKEKSVDVMSGVLDCSVGGWFAMTFEYKEEIEKQMNAITKILAKKNIYHGHVHTDNFCLRFFRTADNKIDFSRPPRVYMIDFDRAKKVL